MCTRGRWQGVRRRLEIKGQAKKNGAKSTEAERGIRLVLFSQRKQKRKEKEGRERWVKPLPVQAALT